MDRPRCRRTIRIPAPSSPEPKATNSFAPFHGPFRCRDGAGRWRAEHSFVVERRDGLHCVFCDALLRMEPC